MNVLKDDLIVRLDQFSSEMLILREEIKSLQTVKAALQLRITELEEESKKSKEELAQKTKKLEEDDVGFFACLANQLAQKDFFLKINFFLHFC